MTAPVILRDHTHDVRFVMARPDPPESDTIVATSSAGDRIEYIFRGYEDGVPVYQAVL